MMVEYGIDYILIVLGAEYVCYIGLARDSRNLVDFLPVFPSILRYLNQALICPYCQQAFLYRGFGEGYKGSVRRGEYIFPNRFRRPYFSHYFTLVAVFAPTEIRAHYRPTVSSILTSKEFLCGKIEAFGVMRTDDQRRIPMPPKGLFIRSRLRLDIESLAAATVIAHDACILRLAIDDMGVFGIDAGLESVPSQGQFPIGIGDAVAGGSSGRAV